MSLDTAAKVSASHLARTAYLYVRQSTIRQVINNTESATRQYGLRQRAVALGWPAGRSSSSTPTKASPARQRRTGRASST